MPHTSASGGRNSCKLTTRDEGAPGPAGPSAASCVLEYARESRCRTSGGLFVFFFGFYLGQLKIKVVCLKKRTENCEFL